MNELNEKLLKFAGIKEEICPVCGGSGKLNYNEGEHRPPLFVNCHKCRGTGVITSIPDFTHDLNACFERLVPRVNEFYSGYITLQQLFHGMWRCEIIACQEGDILAEAETPALALCKAVEQLLEKA